MALTRYQIDHHNTTVGQFLVEDDGDDPYLLDAPYQRQSVWTDARRANLIRSLLHRLPIGGVIINNRGYGLEQPYAVVDGKQRIETVRRFHTGQLHVPAHWWPTVDLADPALADDPDATVTYDGLSPRGKRTFRMGMALPQHGVAGLTVEQEAELYLLVNFGGVAQTDDDRARAQQVAGH